MNYGPHIGSRAIFSSDRFFCLKLLHFTLVGAQTMDEYGSKKEEEELTVTVEITTTKPGDATHFPIKGQTCRVHYEAFLSSDGSKFDSTRDRGLPFEFVLGEGHVVPGWEKTVPKMSLVSSKKD